METAIHNDAFDTCYPGALTACYPSAAAFAAQYLAKCEQPFDDATHSTYPYYSTREQWDAGTTQTQCWVAGSSETRLSANS